MKRLPPGTRVVGLTGNLVPYHHARWQAFAQAGPESCFLLELTNKDEFAVLEFSQAEKSTYHRITLFPQNAATDLSAAGIARRIARELDELRPSCVCLNGYASPLALAALDWCVGHRVPAVMLSESTAWDEPRKAWKEWIKSRVIRLCSSALVGGTPHADYMAQLGIPRERIFTGYDAVDNEHFERGAGKARGQADEIRNLHGLPGKYFLASARFTPKKNLPRLVEAYALYRQGCPAGFTPWDLVILGDGAGRDEIVATRARLGVDKQVHLAGAKPYQDLPAYYGLASAFIHASTTEQWGLVVNEAMASGLPVLASRRCGCAYDLVKEGVNGYMVDPYQAEDIAQKMVRLSILGDRLPAFAAASREIIAKWSPANFADGLCRAVEAALSRPPPRAGWLSRKILQTLIHR